MSEQDWKARAEREAAAVLDSTGWATYSTSQRGDLVALLAATWLQGVNLGSHETLAAVEMAFERVQAEL
jgi:hypothetical protein